MRAFLAIYYGETVPNSKLVALSADPTLVAETARRLLAKEEPGENEVLCKLASGRRAALRAIRREAKQAAIPGDILRLSVEHEKGEATK